MSCKTKMQQAAELAVEAYHHYSKGDDRLNMAEFKKMIEEQFPDCIKNARDPEACAKLFKEFDKDANQEMDFVEWCHMVGRFLVLYHEKLHETEKKHAHPHGHEHAHPHAPHH